MDREMDEIDRLAYRVLDAFEGIAELRLEWLIVPDDPGDGSMLKMEVVVASEIFHAGQRLELEVRAEVTVALEDVRYLGTEQLRQFFSCELIERGGYSQAVAQARVIARAAERGGVPSSQDARRNRARPVDRLFG